MADQAATERTAEGSDDGAAVGATARTRLALEEERDLLLRQLDDLDREHEAGDLDDADYSALRDDYTARAAAVLRRLDGEEPGRPAEMAGARSGGLQRFAVLGGLLAVAIVAGLLLARTVGERGVNDQITGAIDESPRNKVVRCQELGSTGGDLLGSLECFDEVLAGDPDNAEALAYRGWYLLLASGSLQAPVEGDGAGGEPRSADDEANADELLNTGLQYLDRAIEADPFYPDPLAFRASVNDRLGLSEEACADIEALRALDPPAFFLEQTGPMGVRNGC